MPPLSMCHPNRSLTTYLLSVWGTPININPTCFNIGKKHFPALQSLSSSVQSSWLQIQRSGLYSRRYQIFWEVVGLERGPLSLVSKTEELLERKSNGFSVENRDYGSRRFYVLTARDPSIRKTLILTSPTCGGRSVGRVRLRTQAMEFIFRSKQRLLP
jgi:hypothetical protein